MFSQVKDVITTQMRIYKTNIYVWVIAGFFVCLFFLLIFLLNSDIWVSVLFLNVNMFTCSTWAPEIPWNSLKSSCTQICGWYRFKFHFSTKTSLTEWGTFLTPFLSFSELKQPDGGRLLCERITGDILLLLTFSLTDHFHSDIWRKITFRHYH